MSSVFSGVSVHAPALRGRRSIRPAGRLVVLGLLAGFLVPITTSARATTGLTCGSVITTDTVLESDLTCEGDGLKIGAPGITLDLGGHNIVGPGRAGTKGIENPGYEGVAIMNSLADADCPLCSGVVDGFDWGIELRKGTRSNSISQITIQGGRYGVVLFNSVGNFVNDSTIEAGFMESGYDGRGSGAAIALFRSHDNRVARTLSAVNNANGIVLSESKRNLIQENQVARVDDDGNEGTGLTLLNSDKNTILANTFAENHLGDGIFIDKKSTGNFLADNLAVNNAKFGINAVGKAIDGGGNRAFGNGFKAQCRHIRCAKK